MEKLKPNRLRQTKNESIFTGWKNGKYYINGIWQPNKEIRIKRNLPLSGTIFKYRP